MKKIYSLLLTCALAMLSAASMAQSIQGTVADPTGQTIPGATISVANSSQGTATNASGNYTLSIGPGTYQLQVSFVGYETATLPVTVRAGETVSANVTLQESATALQEVAVIGSRSATARTNIQTPVPVDVISARELKSYAQTDVTQILNFVAPSFSSNRQTVSDGTDHIDPASLRGLGPDQVLVLINGKRRHNTALVNINGTFGRGTVGTDLNAIPVAAIERIEVLRDGAAAQYGSDAIAGVINIVLKKETPWAVSALYGQSLSNTLGRNFADGQTTQVDISKGFKLGSKGFFNFGAQYLDRGATNRGGIDTRPLLYSGVWPATPAGVTDVVAYRQQLKAADDAKAVAAGLDRNNMRVGNAAVRNLGLLTNGAYSLGRTELYWQAGITNKQGNAAGFYRLPSQATQVDLTIYPNGFLPQINTDVYDVSASVGLKGKFGGGWNYDLSNTYGTNSIRFDITNTVNASLPTGSSPTELYAGKLIFAQNTVNFDVNKRYELEGILSSINTAFGAEYRVDNYQIQAGEELSYSFGQPSKSIDGRKIGTAFTAAGSQVFPGFKPGNELKKSRNNKAIYADFEGELGKRVLLGLAGRYENYSDFGSNFSYKATGRVTLVGDLALRGAIASGFRAPSLHQRYFNNESTQFVDSVPRQVLTVNNDNPIVRQFGVASLKPEISQSYSVGLTGKLGRSLTFTVDAYQIGIKDRIVFSSQFVREGAAATTQTINQILDAADPNRQINSVQFFTNAIATRTKGLDVVLTERLKFNNKSTLTLMASANFNNTEVTSVKPPSSIEGNQRLVNSLFDRQERARFESSVPRSKVNLSAAYDLGKWNFVARTVRFGEVTYINPNVPGATVSGVPFPAENDQTFVPKWVTDLTVSYQLTKNLNATIGASNLFDVYPDQAYINPRNNATNFSADPTLNYTGGLDNTSNGRFLYGRAVQQFGFNGRFVFARLSASF
ncbi:MAG: TonB-dependent receptor [Cytophagaceae bacterium]|nr:TonB-dependent receptor [Cytophagaceae bacterium]